MRRISQIQRHLVDLEREVDASELSSEFTVSRVFESVSPHEREFISLIFLVPFLQPIPIWGLSSVLGIFLMLTHGAVCVRGKKARIPLRVARHVLSRKTLLLILRGAQKIVGWVESVPEWEGPQTIMRRSVRWNAGAMALLSLFLSLPLPVPASNAIPAYTILFFVFAELSENFFLLALAWLCFVGNLVFFVMLGWLPFLAINLF